MSRKHAPEPNAFAGVPREAEADTSRRGSIGLSGTRTGRGPWGAPHRCRAPTSADLALSHCERINGTVRGDDVADRDGDRDAVGAFHRGGGLEVELELL